MSDKGYNSMSREELKSLSHPVSNGETAETEQDKARKDKTSLRFTLPTPHKVKDKKETNGQCRRSWNLTEICPIVYWSLVVYQFLLKRNKQ